MRYQMLYEIAKGLQEEYLEINPTLQKLLIRTGAALDAPYGCLMSFRDDGQIDEIYVAGIDDTPATRKREIWHKLLSRGLAGYVYHSDRCVIIRNISTDPRWSSIKEIEHFPRSGSAVGIPLQKNNRIYAVMIFVHPEIDYFGEDTLEFLQEVASLASNALANMQQAVLNAESVFDTRYHAIFEHTPVPVVLTDSRGLIVDANYKACEYLGFRRAVLRGIPLQDVNIVSQEEISDIDDEEKYFPTNTYDIDGNAIPTLIRARQIQLDGDNYIEWILQDMSVQMELEQLRRDLTAMVYHDLRGPMGSIHMAINKLAELLQGHENPAVLKILQLGLRSTQQVSRLVEALLDIQRLESGSTILNKQPGEVHVFLTDAFQLVMPIAEHAGISIELDISRMPLVNVDVDMLTRVVINLMENAVKYTPSGSHVTLRTKQMDDKVQIIVSDTGPGIPAEMLDSIFNKFSRVKYQDAPKGVGLGLAFCRLAVEAHGGKIWVESDGENGSDFIFTLPLEKVTDELPQLFGKEDEDTGEYATTA